MCQLQMTPIGAASATPPTEELEARDFEQEITFLQRGENFREGMGNESLLKT